MARAIASAVRAAGVEDLAEGGTIALQFATDHGVPRCLLITSASPAEGKSTTALTLAKNFAQLGKRVLLIDADLRNPSLHKALGLANTGGLSNILAGAAKPNDVLQQTSTAQLRV